MPEPHYRVVVSTRREVLSVWVSRNVVEKARVFRIVLLGARMDCRICTKTLGQASVRMNVDPMRVVAVGLVRDFSV